MKKTNSIIKNCVSIWQVVLLFSLYLTHSELYAQAPSRILSPVIGENIRIGSNNGSTPIDQYTFNQHQSGGHLSGGVGGAIDNLAWDVNRGSANANADVGQNVYPTEDGVIRSSGMFANWGGRTSGQVLVEHTNPNGTKWYSAYLHLNIIVSKIDGTRVTKNTLLGTIGRVGANNDHLHFVLYNLVNNRLTSVNAAITARAAATTSGATILLTAPVLLENYSYVSGLNTTDNEITRGQPKYTYIKLKSVQNSTLYLRLVLEQNGSLFNVVWDHSRAPFTFVAGREYIFPVDFTGMTAIQQATQSRSGNYTLKLYGGAGTSINDAIHVVSSENNRPYNGLPLKINNVVLDIVGGNAQTITVPNTGGSYSINISGSTNVLSTVVETPEETWATTTLNRKATIFPFDRTSTLVAQNGGTISVVVAPNTTTSTRNVDIVVEEFRPTIAGLPTPIKRTINIVQAAAPPCVAAAPSRVEASSDQCGIVNIGILSSGTRPDNWVIEKDNNRLAVISGRDILYVDRTVTDENTHTYRVYGQNNACATNLSTPVSTTGKGFLSQTPSFTGNISATDGSSSNSVILTLPTLPTNYKYRIEREDPNGNSVTLTSNHTSNSYTDNTVTAGIVYDYKVSISNPCGTWSLALSDRGHAGTLVSTSLLEVSAIGLTSPILNGATFDVGSIEVGRTKDTPIYLINRNATEVTVNSTVVDTPFGIANPISSPQNIPPNNGNYRLLTQFSPTSVGRVSKTLTITYGSNQTYTFTLVGEGLARGTLLVTPVNCASLFTFTNTEVGNSTEQEFELTAQNFPVTIQAVGLSAISSTFQFVGGVPSPTVLQVGQTMRVRIAARPNNTGVHEGALVITSNASQTSCEIPLKVTAPQAQGGTIGINPSGCGGNYAFVPVQVNQTSATEFIITATNNPIIIQSITTSNPVFRLMSNYNYPITINAGEQLNVNIHATPNTAGTTTGTLNISSNALNSPSCAVNLSINGTLIPPPPTTTDVTIKTDDVTVSGGNTGICYARILGVKSHELAGSQVEILLPIGVTNLSIVEINSQIVGLRQRVIDNGDGSFKVRILFSSSDAFGFRPETILFGIKFNAENLVGCGTVDVIESSFFAANDNTTGSNAMTTSTIDSEICKARNATVNIIIKRHGDNTPINNVAINTAASTLLATTNTSGEASIEVQNGSDFFASFSKAQVDSYYGIVTIGSVVRIEQIAFYQEGTPLEFLIADGNSDGLVNVLDVNLAHNAIWDDISSYPKSDWNFVKLLSSTINQYPDFEEDATIQNVTENKTIERIAYFVNDFGFNASTSRLHTLPLKRFVMYENNETIISYVLDEDLEINGLEFSLEGITGKIISVESSLEKVRYKQTDKVVNLMTYSALEEQKLKTGETLVKIKIEGKIENLKEQVTYVSAASGLASAPVSVMSDVTSEKVKFFAYPNPTEQNFNLVVEEDGKVSIFSANGVLIKEMPVTAGKNNIDLKNVAKGVYTVSYKTPNSSQTIKVVIE